MSLDTRSEPEIMINTGEILLRRRNGSDGYVAVLYKNLSDTRKPVVKPLYRNRKAKKNILIRIIKESLQSLMISK